MLKQIKGDSWYFGIRVNIGVVIKDDKAILIDSGIDEDYARKVLNALREKGINIAAIITTHAHGDHYGGNDFLKKRTGCLVIAPRLEAAIMENPMLEPIYLFGADPIDELKGKFFMGMPSRPDAILEEGYDGLRIISLAGHSFNMAGIISKENVLYAGDSFFTEEYLDKYKLPYLFDVGKTIESLKFILTLGCDNILLSHGGLLTGDQASAAIRQNLARIEEALMMIQEHLRVEDTIEGVLRHLTQAYSLYVTVPQYFLNLSIIKSYLSYLKKTGRITCFIKEGNLYWKAN